MPTITPLTRPAQPTDCARIAAIYNQYLGISTMDLEPATEKDYVKKLEELDERERLYVLELEGQVIGWGIIRKYSPKLGYQYAGETSVFIDPAYRGRGIGKPFKTFIIEEARRLRYKHLVARIFATNTVSISYNKQLGYEEVGVQRRIGFVNGEWQDVVILQLLL